jgi:hypothetical protein
MMTKEANAQFLCFTEMFETLTDPSRRAAYDRKLRREYLLPASFFTEKAVVLEKGEAITSFPQIPIAVARKPPEPVEAVLLKFHVSTESGLYRCTVTEIREIARAAGVNIYGCAEKLDIVRKVAERLNYKDEATFSDPARRCITCDLASCTPRVRGTSSTTVCSEEFCYHRRDITLVAEQTTCADCATRLKARQILEEEALALQRVLSEAQAAAAVEAAESEESAAEESDLIDRSVAIAAAEQPELSEAPYPDQPNKYFRERPKLMAADLKEGVFIKQQCEHLPWYSSPYKDGERSGHQISTGSSKGSEFGPVLDISSSQRFYAVKVDTECGHVWLNVWTPHNKRGERVGVFYCRILRPKDKTKIQKGEGPERCSARMLCGRSQGTYYITSVSARVSATTCE